MRIIDIRGIDFSETSVEGGEVGAAGGRRRRSIRKRLGGDVVFDWGFWTGMGEGGLVMWMWRGGGEEKKEGGGEYLRMMTFLVGFFVGVGRVFGVSKWMNERMKGVKCDKDKSYEAS